MSRWNKSQARIPWACTRRNCAQRSGPVTAGVVVLAVLCAQLGMNVSWCLVVLMLAPVVTVLGYETVGHRHLAEASARDRQL